jgi:tetratricopeptide (TPR) repeat protein
MTAARGAWVMLGCILWVLSIHPRPALAQAPDEVSAAAEAEARARQAFRDQDYALAARAFAEAFRIDPKAATKYNEALAWNRAGDNAAAADAYETALELGGLDDRLARASSDRLAKLKNQLGRLSVRAPLGASVSVAHAVERSIPTRIHLDPGEHEVTVRHADGSERRETIAIEVGSEREVSFPEPVARTTPEEPPAPEPPVEPEDPAMPIAGWTLIGVGGAALVAMAVTGGLTLDRVSSYDEGGNVNQELYHEAIRLRTATNALLGIGAGLAATGLVIVLVAELDEDGDEDGEGAATATVAVGGLGVSLGIVW